MPMLTQKRGLEEWIFERLFALVFFYAAWFWPLPREGLWLVLYGPVAAWAMLPLVVGEVWECVVERRLPRF